MKTKQLNYLLLLTVFGLSACTGNKKQQDNMNAKYEKGTFGYDVKYLSERDSLIVLKSNGGESQVIVSAKYQGKVFSSTANGLDGKSLGFVNYKVFEADAIDEHMNGYGGENRFWLGPEGGQYSIYFQQGKEQTYDNWHTPKSIDIEPWNVESASESDVSLTKAMELTNCQGNALKILVNRKITILPESGISAKLGVELPSGIKTVAYATDNKITNQNDFEWTAKTGTVCIWMLDMFNPSDSAVTIVPYNAGDEKTLGAIATSDYFGEIPADRLIDKQAVMYLKTDGKYRSKIGVNAKRTTTAAGNYDPLSKRLTIVTFEVDPAQTYLNQEWNPKKNPLVGDALNAYNDGPLDDGSIMGPFLELESCSPAAFLKPGESLSHTHNVFHFVGEEAALSPVCEKLLGVSIDEVKRIF
ncbi:MAG: hypothetical protein LBS52_03970 [Dysgonamonadaceae bacterium]|jgi:hypothetical protein|nr:hypothetical protein [Dysgonamonadaceae bacterium]